MADLTTDQNNQLAVLTEFLKRYNLTGLEGNVKDWIINGYNSERIDLELRGTDTFKQAFPEIEARRAKGLPAVSVDDVVNYRQTVKEVFFNAGLPAGFYDEPQDFVDLMAEKDLSPAELKSRVEDGFMRVYNAPQEIQDTFNSFFGAQGPNMLATFFLDPQKGRDVLIKQVTQAEIAGTGKRFGFDIDIGQAQRLGEIGVNLGTAAQGFEQAAGLRPISEETIGESTDISEGELVSGVLGGDVSAQDRIQRRQRERQAAFGGGGGGAQTQQGFGLGSA